MKHVLTLGACLVALGSQAQLVIQNGATFFIDAGATVTVQGDLTSNANITGTGKVLMKGTSLQSLNTNGFSIPNLEIDNAANVQLTGISKVDNQLTFTAGKLQLKNFNFLLGTAGTFTGAGAGKFAETDGTGEFRKEMNAVGTVTLPVGTGSDYTPVTYQVVGSTVGAGAFVGARAISGGHPAKHPRSTDFLNTYWSLNRNAITGGTVTTVGTYADPSDVTGTEADLRALTFSGGNWSLGTAQDNVANTVTAPMTGNSNDLYAMNRFVLVTPRAMLQGPFDAVSGLMRDRFRNSTGSYTPGTLPASNILPSTDPYRNASLSGAFSHVNNSVPEAVTSTSVFNDLESPENQIVDWVFVELRNINTPTQAPVVQTRSALIQRDGDVVDIDGTSPVYFKNVDGGNYAISIRHRNHLGMSSNPAIPLGLSLSNTNYDLSTAAASGIFGTANTNYIVATSKNQLYAGNVFLNNTSNYIGLNTDRAQILTIMANAAGAPTPARNITTAGDYFTYGLADINMNRVVDYLGVGPDRSFLLSNVLGGNPSPSPAKTQVLPN